MTINYLSLIDGQAFKNALKKVPKNYFGMDEPELRSLAKPTKTDYAIRSALWNEIRMAQESGIPVLAHKIYSGICTYTHFYNNVLGNPKKLAWILQPVQDYEKALEPLLIKMAEKYDELLSINIYDKKGRPVPQLVRQVVQVMTLLENRLLGTPVQRSENKNLSIVHQKSDYSGLSEEEIDKKIEILENKVRASSESIL